MASGRIHWWSYYERLYLPASAHPRPACRLPLVRGEVVVSNIREVNCERCRLRHTHEMQRSLAKLQEEIRASRRKASA